MMKLFTILLALVVINGHLQKGTADVTKYSATERVDQPEQQSPDEGVSCLVFLEAICTMTKCVLPVVELEFKGLTPTENELEILMEGAKEIHFEAPGMFSVSIRE